MWTRLKVVSCTLPDNTLCHWLYKNYLLLHCEEQIYIKTVLYYFMAPELLDVSFISNFIISIVTGLPIQYFLWESIVYV
jgi:hypothetical protein